MKKNIIILFISLIFYTANIASSYSATGDASIYKITMRKLELCTSSTGVGNCEGSITLANFDKVIDIASVTAGASAGSYGDPTLLPLGTSFSHVRVTIDRKFTVKSSGAITASGVDCYTNPTTDTHYAGSGGIAARKYTHKPVVATGSSAHGEQDLYLVNDTHILYTAVNGGSTATGQTQTYDQGVGSSEFQSTHAADTADDHILIYELQTPYTVTLIPPVVDVAFGTKDTVNAFIANSLCGLDAQEPIVKISIK